MSRRRRQQRNRARKTQPAWREAMMHKVERLYTELQFMRRDDPSWGIKYAEMIAFTRTLGCGEPVDIYRKVRGMSPRGSY